MSSNKNNRLLKYYYSKDDQTLDRTLKKYKKYARSLAEKCAKTKADITKLHENYRAAKTLLSNASTLQKEIRKERRRVENGDTAPLYPWCPQKEDDDDVEDEIKTDENNTQFTTALRERQEAYKRLENLVTSAIERDADVASIYARYFHADGKCKHDVTEMNEYTEFYKSKIKTCKEEIEVAEKKVTALLDINKWLRHEEDAENSQSINLFKDFLHENNVDFEREDVPDQRITIEHVLGFIQSL